MIRLEKINSENVWDILRLKVADSQKSFVAGNDISIIEAYTAITANGYAFPFGIYDDNNPVGFVMLGYDKDDYWKDAPAIADGNYNLWRLMIDENDQNKGYGKQAVELALRFVSTFPFWAALTPSVACTVRVVTPLIVALIPSLPSAVVPVSSYAPVAGL